MAQTLALSQSAHLAPTAAFSQGHCQKKEHRAYRPHFAAALIQSAEIQRPPTSHCLHSCLDNSTSFLTVGQGFLTSQTVFRFRKSDACRWRSSPSKSQSTASSEPQEPASEEVALQKPGLEQPLLHVIRELEGDSETASKAAQELLGHLNAGGRAAILSALFQTASENVDDIFKSVDVNADGTLSKEEFSEYVEAQALEMGKSNRPPTKRQLYLLSLRAAIGNIGFGFTDNVIMILAGDVIQNSLGSGLGLSTLMSAGLGNCIADVIGTAFKESMEGASSHFMPHPKASPFQLATREAWWAETTGASVGVAAGCILGLSPLFIMGRWRAVDDIEIIEKTNPGLISSMGDGTPETALLIAQGASGPSQSGESSPYEAFSEASQSSVEKTGAAEESVGTSTTGSSASSARSQDSKLTAMVSVPQPLYHGQRALDRTGGVWVFLAMAVFMCLKRLYQLRHRRALDSPEAGKNLR